VISFVGEMARWNIVERRLERFLEKPTSVRNAAAVIVVATTLVVIGGGVLIRLIDPAEYDDVGTGMWWALQTVTTVGYGDVTPTQVGGRLVGAVVMLEGTAFIAIVTAAITSTFVARASREHREASAAEGETEVARMEQRFDELERKLDLLLGAQAGPGP
jgi:voltage-gated potassium channel Kch